MGFTTSLANNLLQLCLTQRQLLQHPAILFFPFFFSFLKIKPIRSYLCPSSNAVAASLHNNLSCTAAALSCPALLPAVSSRLNKPSSPASSQRLFSKPLISAEVLAAWTSHTACCCPVWFQWWLPASLHPVAPHSGHPVLQCRLGWLGWGGMGWDACRGQARVLHGFWGPAAPGAGSTGARPPGRAERRNWHVHFTPLTCQEAASLPYGACPGFPGSGKSPALSSAALRS